LCLERYSSNCFIAVGTGYSRPRHFFLFPFVSSKTAGNHINEDKSAAGFCCKVAAWFPDMDFNFYFVKNNKISKNSSTTEDKEKISIALESLGF
jgi:hypothetical protein